MFASVRRPFFACTLTGVLLASTATSAAATDRFDDPPAQKPSFEMMLASTTPFVPAATLPTLTADAQAPTSPLSIPRTTGFEGATVRRSLIVSFAALQLMDAHSTVKALGAGGRESNPAMAGLASNRTALFAVKAGTAAATAYFAERLSRNHPRRATILMVVLNTAYAGIVAHNYRVARAR